jgi:hypothetical protein
MMRSYGPNLDISAESQAIFKTAHHALTQMDKQAVKSFTYWKAVGEAFVEMRKIAMRHAGTNRPYGRAYTATYGRLLVQCKFADRIKDPGDRQKLVAVMDNLPAVEAWLETLSKEDRRRWTHPTTIYKQWQKSLLPPRTYPGIAPSTKTVVQDALAAQLDAKTKENSALKIKAQHSVDLLHAALAELEEWFEAGCLQRDREDWLRDLLNRRHARRQPMPKMPVTDPDDDDEMD